MDGDPAAIGRDRADEIVVTEDALVIVAPRTQELPEPLVDQCLKAA